MMIVTRPVRKIKYELMRISRNPTERDYADAASGVPH
jgi:hypothetical protein